MSLALFLDFMPPKSTNRP